MCIRDRGPGGGARGGRRAGSPHRGGMSMTAPVRRVTGTGSVTWGVPWPRGQVSTDASFRLGEVPVQSWPLATWPDGSLKWSGHATSWVGSGTLEVGEPATPDVPVSYTHLRAHETVLD